MLAREVRVLTHKMAMQLGGMGVWGRVLGVQGIIMREYPHRSNWLGIKPTIVEGGSNVSPFVKVNIYLTNPRIYARIMA